MLRKHRNSWACRVAQRSNAVTTLARRTPYTPLAFDFDFSGLVNAPYAQPNRRYSIEHVWQRLYKGQCRNNDRLPGTIQRFLDIRESVYDLIDSLDTLDRKSRRHLSWFLDLLYKRISDPESVRKRFEKRCRKNL